MFSMNVLEVATGLIFLYLLLSLVCSAMAEMIEGWLKVRARQLKGSIEGLLKPEAREKGLDLSKAVYEHPLVFSLFKGDFNSGSARYLPSYIPSKNFALAVLGLLDPEGGAPKTILELKKALEKTRPELEPVKRVLRPLVDAAGEDLAKAQANIEAWFDSSMERVSGWYKRHAQRVVFWMGLLLALVINADTITMSKALYTQETKRAVVVKAAGDYLKAHPTPTRGEGAIGESSRSASDKGTAKADQPAPTTTVASARTPSSAAPPNARAQPGSEAAATSGPPSAQQLADFMKWVDATELPLGWENEPWPGSRSPAPDGNPQHTIPWYAWPLWVLLKVAGIFLTAMAVSFGAPFWFDLLNKFVTIRSTLKPQKKESAS